MTYFGILQTLKVCAVVSCILQKRKVYGHRIYKCEIRYIYKCKSLGELTSASREESRLARASVPPVILSGFLGRCHLFIWLLWILAVAREVF